MGIFQWNSLDALINIWHYSHAWWQHSWGSHPARYSITFPNNAVDYSEDLTFTLPPSRKRPVHRSSRWREVTTVGSIDFLQHQGRETHSRLQVYNYAPGLDSSCVTVLYFFSVRRGVEEADISGGITDNNYISHITPRCHPVPFVLYIHAFRNKS